MDKWIATSSESMALAVLKLALKNRTVSLPNDPVLQAELLSLKERRLRNKKTGRTRTEIYTESGQRPSRALAVAHTLEALNAKPGTPQN